jgi:hypothetical protein
MLFAKTVGASRNPDQYSSSGSQSNGSMTPVILGWILINGSPGRNKFLTWDKAAQRTGTLGPLLNRRNGLSIRNGVLLYKQLNCPMMDYGCPVWRSAARSHIKKLQVMQSKCLCIATNTPWYICDRKIHDDFKIPYLSDHISLRDSARG